MGADSLDSFALIDYKNDVMVDVSDLALEDGIDLEVAEARLDSAKDFIEKAKVLKTHPPVRPFDFYRTVFPEGSLERKGHPEDKKGNAIAVCVDTDKDKKLRGMRTVVTDGLEQIPDLLRKPMPVLSPVSYFGRSRAASNALWLYALTFDIDYVEVDGLKNMLQHFEKGISPIPTFIVNSGHGVHLYYVLEEPIALYQPAQIALKELRKALIPKLWNKYTSEEPDKIEALGVVHGFRMVGAQSKLGPGYTVTAYQIGERVTLDYLNQFVPEKSRAVDFEYQPKVPLEEAKERWPEWYERRIVRGEKAGRWYVKRALYDWFKRQIMEYGSVGHRYHCIMCLAIYAAKCGIKYDELLNDAQELQEYLNGLSQKEPFTWSEALKALESYNENTVHYTREFIVEKSAVPMMANKRNGRNRDMHLKRARRIKAGMIEDGDPFRNPEGRPVGSGTKEEQIKAYAAAHPKSSNRQIAEALGVSRNTVNKWLKQDSDKKTKEALKK